MSRPRLPTRRSADRAERVTIGVIMATASDLHLELIHKMSEHSVWNVWKAIEAQHQQQDASLRHEAWMQLFAIRKEPNETYVDFYQQDEAARSKIDHVTPSDLTPAKCSEELDFISGLAVDDPMHRQLISQKDVALADAYSSFLCTDRGEPIKTESAHVALGSNCSLCRSLDHIVEKCPHRDAITSLVARRNGGGDGKSKKGKGRNNGPGSVHRN